MILPIRMYVKKIKKIDKWEKKSTEKYLNKDMTKKSRSLIIRILT